MKARPYNSLQNICFLICTVIMVMLSSLLGGCSRKQDFSSATEMRDYLSKALKSDTSTYAKEQIPVLRNLQVDSQKKRKEVFGIMNKVTNYYLHNGRNVDAIRFLNGALPILEDEAELDSLETRSLIGMYVCIGAAYEQAGMPGVGLDYYMKGLKLTADTTFAASRAMLYNNVGVLYCEGGIYDKGEDYFKKALDINLKSGNNLEIYINYTNLADTYEHTGDLTRAIDVALRSLQHVTPEKNPESYYFTQIALANLYNRSGQEDLATSYVENAIKHLEKINYVIGMVEAYEAFARIYLKRQMPDSAMVYADKALRIAGSAGLHRNESSSLSVMIDVCNQLGNTEKSIKMLERSRHLEDSLHNAEKRLRLTQWEATSASAPENQQQASNSLNKWLIGGCALLLAAIIAVILLYFRMRRSQDKKLQEDAEQNRELVRTLDRKNRELTTLSLEKMQAHEGLMSICEDLRQVLLELNPKLTAQRARIRELLGKLTSMSEGYSDEEFKRFFEDVHPDFYKALEERCPDLTMRDLRLCAFLYLGLTTKEIATITYREVRSVESARNRLRKKLGLDLSEDLTAFLRNVSQASK